MNRSASAPDFKNFSNYGIAAFVLCGFFVAIFGAVSAGDPAQTRVFLIAEGFNIYFALAIGAGVQKFRHLGIAVLIALIPCALSLFLRFQYLPVILSIVYLIIFTRRVKNFGFQFNLGAAALALLAGGVYAFIVLGTHQVTDIFFSSKMAVGQYSTDSFFHMAIASMLEKFGQASMGAHGVVPINYYTFSHYFFAASAYIGNISVLNSYATIYSIVLIPLIFLCLSGVAEEIARSQSSSEYIFRLFLIGLIFVGFLGYGPGSISDRYAMWISFFESESYTLSLILLLALLSIFYIESFPAQSVAVAICLILMCLTKASTGVIAYGIYTGYLLFFNKQAYWRRLAAFGLIALCMVIALKSVASTVPEILEIRYFDFVKSYVLEGYSDTAVISSLVDWQFWKVFLKFAAVHFFFSWVCLLLVLNSVIFPSTAKSANGKAVIYNLIALSAGFIAVIFMALPGGAAYYFNNVAMFVALPFVIAYMGTAFSTAPILRNRSGLAVIPIVVLCFGVHNLIPQTLNLKRSIVGKSSHLPITADNVGFAGYLHQLESIRKLPATQNMLVYVAKENTDFWEAKTTASCMAQAFAIVAVSERPAIYGLPNKARCNAVFYGFNSYSDDLFASSARVRISEADLLAETGKLGFDGYIEVTRTAWQIHRAR